MTCAVIFAIYALVAKAFPVQIIYALIRSSTCPLPLYYPCLGLSILAMISFSVAVIIDSIAASQRFN
jgi:hypothetical protein